MKQSQVTVLLTRESGDNDALARRVASLGARIIENPLIEVRCLEMEEKRPDWHLNDAIMVTSGNALRAMKRSISPTILDGRPCYVVGARTALTARRLGLEAVHPDGVKTASDLVDFLCQEFRQGQIRHLFWPHGQLADVNIIDRLELAGYKVDHLVCYETHKLAVTEENLARLNEAKQVIAVFYSPSAVEAFAESVIALNHPLPNRFASVAIGPSTGRALAKLGIPLGAVAATVSEDGVLQAIEDICERGF